MMFKKKVLGFVIVGSLVAGGSIGYATASMYDELKDDYHKEIKTHMDGFVPVDQSKRVQDETKAYLNKRLAEFDREANDLKKREADQVIKELKQFIDAEIAQY